MMTNEKMTEMFTETKRRQVQEIALIKANNNKLDKLVKLQNDVLNLIKCQNEMLDFNSLCLYLGLSSDCLYKLTSSKTIPFHKPFGKKLYFKKSEIDELIFKNQIKPNKSFDEFEIEHNMKKILSLRK